MLANPQSRFLSPTFLLILIFDTVKGIKLEIFLHLIIGLLGMYLLARHYKMDAFTAWLPAFVFMLNSMYVLNLTVGMTWFLSVAYMPWAFLYYLKGFEHWKFILLSGLFLVLMYFAGGAYPLSITILFFALFSLLFINHHGFVKVAKLFVLLIVFTVCLGAIKFFPSFVFLSKNPRHISDYSGYSVEMLMHSLLNRDQSLDAFKKYPAKEGFWDGRSWQMDENGMYIGFIPILLFLIGILIYGKRRWRLMLCFLVFLLLAFGNRIPISLWKFLHALPVYNSMRVAQRFRIVFMLIMALFVGFGFQLILRFIKQRTRANIRSPLVRLLKIIIPIIILIDLVWVNSPIFQNAFPIPPIKSERQAYFSQISKLQDYDANGFVTKKSHSDLRSSSALYPAFLSNVGTIDGYETANVPRKAIPRDSKNYKGEVFLEGTPGKVSVEFWSPNRIVLSIHSHGKGYLVLNQNFYSGWKVKGGQSKTVQAINSLLAVAISSEDTKVEFYYSPLSFHIGWIVTCLTILVGISAVIPYSGTRQKVAGIIRNR